MIEQEAILLASFWRGTKAATPHLDDFRQRLAQGARIDNAPYILDVESLSEGRHRNQNPDCRVSFAELSHEMSTLIIRRLRCIAGRADADLVEAPDELLAVCDVSTEGDGLASLSVLYPLGDHITDNCQLAFSGRLCSPLPARRLRARHIRRDAR